VYKNVRERVVRGEKVKELINEARPRVK